MGSSILLVLIAIRRHLQVETHMVAWRRNEHTPSRAVRFLRNSLPSNDGHRRRIRCNACDNPGQPAFSVEA